MAVRKSRPLKKKDGEDKKDLAKAATWVVAISGLIAAIAALISAIATLVMAVK